MDSTAVVNVRLVDINDNAPVFDHPPYLGHIMENSKIGTLIMTVKANDYDDPNMGQNSVLKYQIAENKKFGNIDIFSINETTGQIFTNVMLDREQIDKYTIEVCATDGSGKRGCGQVTIYVDDANDQAPVFQSSTYTVTINEDVPIDSRVLMVTAIDKDIGTNAELSYDLKSECLVRDGVYRFNDLTDCVNGIGEPKYFKVDTEREANSGFIKLAKPVNYDPPDFHRLFKLNVSVTDGVAFNYTTVFVNIADVNDEAPRFLEPVKNIRILESIPPLTLLTNFTAEDLDTNELNRKFTYSIDRDSDGSYEFTIDQTGSIYNLEKLDRETKDKYILRIFATDEGFPSQTGIATLNIELVDVNDNYPVFAQNYRPIIDENSRPDQFILNIRAKDLDDPRNGPPFKLAFPDIVNVWPTKNEGSKFNMSFIADNDANNGDDSFAQIFSMVRFDREATDCRTKSMGANTGVSENERSYIEQNFCKEYQLPILMSDSGTPPQSGVNYLTVVIGDVNDNLHYPGTKNILIYDYKGSVTRPQKRHVNVGTVFADDKDDWDAVDKIFTFKPDTDDYILKHFELVSEINENNEQHKHTPGSILVKPGVKAGAYEFQVNVKDRTRPEYDSQLCTVSILIKTLSEDAVLNSGSVRLSGTTAERLIETRYAPLGRSYLSEIKRFLALKVFNLKNEDLIDVFSLTNNNQYTSVVDLRYTINQSPFHKPTRLNGMLAHNKTQFQNMLSSLDTSIKIVSIGIDECVESEKRCKDSGCQSYTTYTQLPVLVNANKTAVCGLHAVENAECTCKAANQIQKTQNVCDDKNYCLNGGVCINSAPVYKCKCPYGYNGPRCQKLIAHFNSSGGFTWLKSLPQCQDFLFSFEFLTTHSKGLLFYNGPIVQPITNTVDPIENKELRYQQDFVSVQLDKGKLVLSLRQGINMQTKNFILNNMNRTLNDGHWHRIDIYKTRLKYRITIDRCQEQSQENRQTSSVSYQSPNVNVVSGCEHEIHLEINDMFININYNYPLQLAGVYDRRFLPKMFDFKGSFVGCMRNLQFNGEYYDLEISTFKTIGLSSNSMNNCPRADRLCNKFNDTNFCSNGYCDADYESAQCVCKPGYRGRNCEIQAQAFDFQTPSINKRAGSYLKYRYVHMSDYRNSVYDAYLRRFTKIQLLFRTRENTTDRPQTLFQITSPNRAQYIYLEIEDNRLQLRYDIGSGECTLKLSNVIVNDGKWHFVKAERYGKEASLIIDDGEHHKMNYTYGLPNGAREMEIDRDSIFLGNCFTFTLAVRQFVKLIHDV
jgi:hypothetical protein